MKKTSKRILGIALAALLIAVALVGGVSAATMTVGTSGANYTTIADAMTHVSSSDDIIILVTNVTENVTVNNTFTLDLNGYVLKGTGSGSVITINSGSLTLKDTSNAVKYYISHHGSAWTQTNDTSGAIDITEYTASTTDGTIVKTNGGCITGGSSSGVYVNGGTFTMESGNIVGNTGSSYSGGVTLYGGTFTLNDGTICGNVGDTGGGVAVMNITGGETYLATFTMTDGSINGNTASVTGGGVYYYGENITMTGGSITGNRASVGGGVFDGGKSFTMTGGSINGNTATVNAGGVGVSLSTPQSSMTVGGTAQITGNTYNSDPNNLYLTTGNLLTVNNGFTGSIGVLLQNGTGAFTNTCADTAADYFSSDNEAYKVEYNTDHLELVPSTVHVTGVSLNKTTAKIAVDGTETLTAKVSPADATDKSVTWSSSNSAVANVSEGVVTGVAPGTATITVTTTDGNKTATCTVTVYALVTFDGNGGSGTMDPQEFTGVSQKLSKNTYDKDGYVVGGWADEPNGKPIYADEQEITVTEDTTLYAYWIEESGTTKEVPKSAGEPVSIQDTSSEEGAVSSVTFTQDPGDNVVLVYKEETAEESIPNPNGMIIRSTFDINLYRNGDQIHDLGAVVKFTVDKSAVSSTSGVKLAHWIGTEWEYKEAALIPEDDDKYVFTAEVDSFSPFAIVGPNPSSGSSVTSFFGEKNGNDFTFDKAVVITKATLPGASSATVTNTSGAGWYNCNLVTDSITGNGILYFQVPLDVLKVKGYTVNDVSLVGCKTTYLKSENGYAKYSAVITKGGALTIDFEEDATTTTAAEKVQEVVEQKQTATEQKQAAAEKVQETVEQKQTAVEQKQTAAKSPFPILGILAGLGIAGFVALRRR